MTDVAKQFSGKLIRASEPSPHVCLLELNRGPVNAFNDALWLELRAIVEAISRCDHVRVIVLSSAIDKIWTAGLDITQTTLSGTKAAPKPIDPARAALNLNDHMTQFQDAISSLEKATQPVIAAIHGIAYGLAIDIACACDVRIVSEDVKLSIMEVKVGLAADIGTLQRFPKIVGNGSVARELALTGRVFGANEAKEIGFVSQVVKGGRKEATDAALALAKVIAANSPIAVTSTKHIITHARDHSVADSLKYQAAWNMSMLQSEDTKQAMVAQKEKRVATFRSLYAKL